MKPTDSQPPAPPVRAARFRPGAIVIRGAGEMATGTAVVLLRHGMGRIILTETTSPHAVRRRAAFSEAVFDGESEVEGVRALLAADLASIDRAWSQGAVAVVVDPDLRLVESTSPAVIVDATLRKRVADFRIDLASVTIALGPGFVAGRDCHAVVETQRGASLGRVIFEGSAENDTGIPAPVEGITNDRLLKAPIGGVFRTSRDIGETVSAGEVIGRVEGAQGDSQLIHAAIGGRIRGLLRDGTTASAREKLGDIDPRVDPPPFDRISDKALAIGAGVFEAIGRLAGRSR